MVTLGEAETHYFWIDEAMLGQVTKAINGQPEGSKSRFTHPGLSGDGLGKVLGRFRDAQLDGDVVRADLHFFEAAHEAPDGDLAAYVMGLAEEDPKVFGNSIVFQHDRGSEREHEGKHSDKEGNFTSPDKANKQNLPHARLARLRGVDVVDSPAANPSGLFHRGDEIAAEASACLSYALGLSKEQPVLVELGIDADRVSGFVSSFLNQHGLEIVSKENKPMSESKQKDGAQAAEADALRAEGAKTERQRFAALNSEFSDKGFVCEQFAAEKSVEDAQTAWSVKENSRLAGEVEELKAKITALSAENEKPKTADQAEDLSMGGSTSAAAGGNGAGVGFDAVASALAGSEGIDLAAARARVAQEQPDLYAAHRASFRK